MGWNSELTINANNIDLQSGGITKGVWVYETGSKVTLNAIAEEGLVKISGTDCVICADNQNSSITVNADKIDVTGRVYAGAAGAKVYLNGDNVTLNAVENQAAVEVKSSYGETGFGSNVAVAEIGTVGNDSKSIVNINNVNGDSRGLKAQYVGTKIDVYGSDLNINGNDGIGISASNSGEVVDGDYFDYRANVNVYSDNTKINMPRGTALAALSYGVINIEGNLEIVAEDAIAARGNSTTNINQSGDKVVQIDGDIVFDAARDEVMDAEVNLNLSGEESYLNGRVYTYTYNIVDGQVKDEEISANEGNRVENMKLGLSDGATWTVTDDSFLSELTGEGGNIKVDMTEDGEIATVDVATNSATDTQVSGTGAVSDYLAANGKDAEAELAESVTDASGKAIDAIITTEEGMTGGAYTIKVTDDGVVAEQATNTKSDAVSDAGMTMKGHWRAHMNDMNKRMGELRMANGEHGVWTRMVRGESEYQGAKMQYNQYQLGYDEKLSVDKRWTVGAAITFSEGDSSYGSGSTDDKSTAFAIYGSKLNNDGTFVDLIARYAHLESDLDDRNYGTGDYSTNGMSVSAEFGKRIQQGNGLWIEPQVELTYGSVDSADVAFDGGAYKAHYDSMDSFIARAGFALGKDIKQGNVYARASYLYDFDGETETQFEGGKAISEDFGGGWWEVGVGANINLSKATYIYADIEKTFGGEVDTNWQWNLGVRYSF